MFDKIRENQWINRDTRAIVIFFILTRIGIRIQCDRLENQTNLNSINNHRDTWKQCHKVKIVNLIPLSLSVR